VNRKFWLVAFLSLVLLAVLPLLASAQVLMRSGYSTLSYPNSVVAADFNHDGVMDFAVSSYYSYDGGPGVEVFLGNGDGTFKPGVKYVVASGAGSLAVGDLNNDGIPDLVASCAGADAVCVLLGNGDGTFQAPVSYAVPSAAVAVVLGDFNNDGNLDVATAIQDNDTTSCECVAVLLGNGNGTFQEPAVITYPPLGAGPLALAAGYFSGNGNLDLALTENFTFSGGAAQILLGNGDGTFTLGTSYALFNNSLAIVAADLRNNGQTDLAVAESGGALAVLLADGGGTFQPAAQYYLDSGTSLSGFPETLAVGDMNGDGIPDLVSAPGVIANNLSYSAVYIFLGKGDGTFGSPEICYPFGDSSSPRGLALADFNGDGQPDLTFGDQVGSGLSEYVLLNTGQVKFSPVEGLSFTNQKHGTTSPPQVVTLTNEGPSTLNISSMTTAENFEETSTCGKSVAAKQSCTISVTFRPTTAGEKYGTVSIIDSASSKPQVIALSGTAY
jgi:hypothetical protein